jgi:predicted SprT family Zn-dependent metalloprotease
MKMTKRQRKAARQLNYSLFDESFFSESNPGGSRDGRKKAAQESLPPLSTLYSLFDRFNYEYFGGRLPMVTISYSERMLIAGSYTSSTEEIKIGRKYHTIFPEELEDTLKHEMIHIVYPNHSPEFKRLARKLGVSLKAREHPDLRAAWKYLYICPHCGKEYPRRKRLRLASCGVCTPGVKYDPRYKLILSKSAAKKSAGRAKG